VSGFGTHILIPKANFKTDIGDRRKFLLPRDGYQPHPGSIFSTDEVGSHYKGLNLVHSYKILLYIREGTFKVEILDTKKSCGGYITHPTWLTLSYTLILL
jgi:hypothetical protein